MHLQKAKKLIHLKVPYRKTSLSVFKQPVSQSKLAFKPA